MHVHVATYDINSTGHYTYTNSRLLHYHNVWFTFIFWISFTQDHWNSYQTLYAKRTIDNLIGQTYTQYNNFDNIFQYLNTFKPRSKLPKKANMMLKICFYGNTDKENYKIDFIDWFYPLYMFLTWRICQQNVSKSTFILFRNWKDWLWI